jgi:hypothetical protein
MRYWDSLVKCAYCNRYVRASELITVGAGTDRERVTCPCVYDFTDAELDGFKAQLDAWRKPKAPGRVRVIRRTVPAQP